MMVFVALMELIPFYMNISFNCKRFRDISGDKKCPMTLKMMFGPNLFTTQVLPQREREARAELAREVILSNWFVSHFCMLMMVITCLWVIIYQELMLRQYSRKIKVSDRCLMLCNLWNNTTSEGLERYLEELCVGVKIEVDSVSFVNARLGNMNRRRRIRMVEEVVQSLELDFEISEEKNDKKFIKKVIKEYKKWLGVYKSELRLFERYSHSIDNQQSAIAFITVRTKDQAALILKKEQRNGKCGWLAKIVRSLSNTFCCCFCIVNNSQ